MIVSLRGAAALLLATIATLAAVSPSSAQGPTPVRPQAAPAPDLSAPAPQGAPATEPTPAVEPATGVLIAWSVANRFRLFREERDFHRLAEAAQGRTILETEHALAEATQGRGWARDMVERLCLDAIGRVTEQCVRDGVRESYLNPADHRVELQLAGTVPAGATCSWTLGEEANGPAAHNVDCTSPITARLRHGRSTQVRVDIAERAGVVRRAVAEIVVRDLLIAGLGDSIASGDGNPDRPVALSDEGFCFRRFVPTGKAEYFRPGRSGFGGDRDCAVDVAGGTERSQWARLSAHWMTPACHRSLYGYQLRAALALAIENPHLAVTFVPLACTGATIVDGLFNGQRARELNCGVAACPERTPAQIAELQDIVARARRGQPGRALDLVFLTIGANDIAFSGLIADIMIEAPGERSLFARAGIIASVDAAERTLETRLPGDFARLRAALKPLVNNALERVVFVSYGNPALSPDGGACPGGRGGFDIHPAFGVDGERLRRTATFVQDRFLPALKNIATCSAKGAGTGASTGANTGAGACQSAADAMTFVDEHQAAFAQHGFCARADTDPPFDRHCFRQDGRSFSDSLVEGALQPLACGAAVSEFHAYARRARWIRTPNDSYFAAMTFPEGVSAVLQPASLHDATWGVLSAVYGGAIHPTAEGHAAMADAALAGAKRALQLPGASEPIVATPLPPVPGLGR
jgi:hypothetical protein